MKTEHSDIFEQMRDEMVVEAMEHFGLGDREENLKAVKRRRKNAEMDNALRATPKTDRPTIKVGNLRI